MGRTFSPRLYLLLQSMGNKRAHYTFKSEIQVLTLSTNLKSFNYPEPQSPCPKEEIKIDLIGLLWGLNNTLKASLKACYVVGIKECQFPSSSLGHTPLVRRFVRKSFQAQLLVFGMIKHHLLFEAQRKSSPDSSILFCACTLSLFQCVTVICQFLFLPLDCELLRGRDYISLILITSAFRKIPGT